MTRRDFAFAPRAMSIDAAAFYCGQMSAPTFRAEMRCHGIEPVTLSRGRLGYLKEDLDAYLDHKAGRAPSSEDEEGAEWIERLHGNA